MNRLFQHYEGEIRKIEGLTLRGLELLINNESGKEDIILIWMQTGNKWLRIFIDGCYCGIDEYDQNKSKNDIDDGISLINKDSWVKGLVIKNANVESKDSLIITLIINFTNETQLILDLLNKKWCQNLYLKL